MIGRDLRGRAAVWALALGLGACGDDGAPSAGAGTTSGAEPEAGTDAGTTGEPGDPTAPTSTSTSTTGDAAQCEEGGTPMTDDGGEDDGGSTGGHDSTLGMDDDMPLVAEVYDVQQAVFGPGDLVTIPGVVVTTPVASYEATGGREVFVQDPMGGPYSGVRVRLGSDPGIEVGERVTVTGRVRGRRDFVVIDTGVAQGEFTAMGPGVVPEPPVLSADALRLDDAAARPYEGMPIRVEQVVVTDADPCDGEFEIEQTLRVDDRFVPGELTPPAEGTTLTVVEGVLVDALDAYELAPSDAGGIQ